MVKQNVPLKYIFPNFIYHLTEDESSHQYIYLHARGRQYGLYVRIGTIDEEKIIRSATLYQGDS